MTFSKMILSKRANLQHSSYTKFSIHETQYNVTQHKGIICDNQHNATKHSNTAYILKVVVLKVAIFIVMLCIVIKG